MELSWFRRPGETGGGTLNACFNAVDRHVVRGAADHPAVRGDTGEVDFATLLEQVGALAGVLRGFAVDAGTPVAAALDDPRDRLLFLLACLRLGAVHAELSDPAAAVPFLVASSRPVPDGLAPTATLLRGVPVTDAERELDWDVALRMGRTDPAACADVPAAATAYVVDGAPVALVDAATHDSWPGRALATLCAGQALDLTGGPA